VLAYTGNLYSKWSFGEIRAVFTRRHLLRPIALEIFLTTRNVEDIPWPLIGRCNSCPVSDISTPRLTNECDSSTYPPIPHFPFGMLVVEIYTESNMTQGHISAWRIHIPQVVAKSSINLTSMWAEA
ncbi:hypothetical protein ACTXT7_017502, partial [Hymenolepis weldensis]